MATQNKNWLGDQVAQTFIASRFKFGSWNMAFSIAASYTWAAAILVGLSMIQGQGVIPYAVWFVSNGLALIVFGWATTRFPDLYKVARMPLFRLLIAAVAIGTIWFNMSGMMYINGGLSIVSNTWATVIVLAASTFAWAYIRWPKITGANTKVGGINISIITDRYQWILVLGGVIVAAIITLADHPQLAASSFVMLAHPLDGWRDWYNAFWACPLLLTGLFCDGMMWQRAPYIKTMKPWVQAYGMFMVYLALAAVLAIFKMPDVARWIIYLCIFFAAMSTIDSCLSALWHQWNKKWGTVLGFVIIWVWLALSAFPLFNLWQMLFSWFPFIAAAMWIAYALMKKGWLKAPSEKTLRAEDALPVLGERTPFSPELKNKD